MVKGGDIKPPLFSDGYFLFKNLIFFLVILSDKKKMEAHCAPHSQATFKSHMLFGFFATLINLKSPSWFEK